MATTIPNPKGLEGRKEGQTPAPQSRDFFWDSITLYIVAVILGLAAIDVITEFVRGSEVQCILPNETNSSLLASVRDYVNEFCAAHVPSLQSLPAFIALHAVFLLAPHYMWLNVYGADLDFFFQHVSQLVRTRDPKTGDYPAINYVISKQLEDAFTRSAHSNWMYHLYRIKLLVQLGFIIVGITVVPLLFKEQQVPFQCPKEDNDAKGDEWPLPDRETVVCVFSSLRLLQNVWGVYLFLLTGAIVFLIINMLMLMMPHTRELGFDNHAEFSFQTGMSYHYYVPHSLKKYFLEKFHCSLSWPFSPYSIRSDYDFLMIKLFRTDGGLAYILRETHILRLLNTKNSSDLAKVNLFRDKINVIQPRHAEKFWRAEIGWNLLNVSDHVLICDHRVLTLPPTIRGVVLGFALRCEGSSVVHALPPDDIARIDKLKERADDAMILAKEQVGAAVQQVAVAKHIVERLPVGGTNASAEQKQKKIADDQLKKAETQQTEASSQQTTATKLKETADKLRQTKVSLKSEEAVQVARIAQLEQALELAEKKIHLKRRLEAKPEQQQPEKHACLSPLSKAWNNLEGEEKKITTEREKFNSDMLKLVEDRKELEKNQRKLIKDQNVMMKGQQDLGRMQVTGTAIVGTTAADTSAVGATTAGATGTVTAGTTGAATVGTATAGTTGTGTVGTAITATAAVGIAIPSTPRYALSNAEEQLLVALKQSGKFLCGALCIGFDSESQGIPSALARVFLRVGSINFSSYYTDYQNPLKIDVDNTFLMFSATTPYDILTRDGKVEVELPLDLKGKRKKTKLVVMSEKFLDDLNEVWKHRYIFSKRSDDIHNAQPDRAAEDSGKEVDQLSLYKTNYIVIGPVSDDLQIATVNKLLERKKDKLSRLAVLLTIMPMKMGFCKYNPPKHLFEEIPHLNAELHDGEKDGEKIFSWPRSANEFRPGNLKLDTFMLKPGQSEVEFQFALYRRHYRPRE